MSKSLCGLSLKKIPKTQSTVLCAKGGLMEVSANEGHIVIPQALQFTKSTVIHNHCPMKSWHRVSLELIMGESAGAHS